MLCEMPSLQDWIRCPMAIVDSIYDKHGEEETWDNRVFEFFGNKISDPKLYNELPLLNHARLHELQSGQLCRFRCMVQDMQDPEFYVKRYVSRDLRSGKRRYKCGLLKDLADCGPHEEAEMEGSDAELCSRMSYYCISIPGESSWVTEESKKFMEPKPSTSGLREKRSLDEETEDDVMESDECSAYEASKRSRTSEQPTQAASTSAQTWLNFPFPSVDAKAVLVKVYDKEFNASLNALLEVVGVLSMDPSLSNDFMETDELTTRSPPASLVPRLHAVSVTKLAHTNPYLPYPHHKTQWDQACDDVCKSGVETRESIVTFLSKVLFGDEVAAEYLLCHFLSKVYMRRDVMALGSLSLNLFGVPVMSDYVDKLYSVLRELLERSYKLDLTLENLNQGKFVPKKDYDSNQLKSGYLQLPAQTSLFVDETKICGGQLQQQGVANLLAIGNLIRWQRLEYDFEYHRMEFCTDIQVLVLSDGKSLFPCEMAVPVQPARPIPPPESLSEQFHNLLQDVSSLVNFRSYITVARMLDYTLPADLQKIIQEDFVEMRKEDSSNMTREDLDHLLVLARLLSLSRCERTLTKQTWERAKFLEKERKQRISRRNS